MDTAPIRRFLEALFQPGDIFEVRAPDCRERRDARYDFTSSGYFTFESLDAAVTGIAELDRSEIAPGIYVTINPVAPALLARAANRIRARARETTQDKDIVRRRWLLIDVDPARPAGVSATDAELALALDRACAVAQYLASAGWPAPIRAMSGNGYHLLYRIELPTNDDGLVKAVLAALANRFSDDAVAVDRAVHNAARIIKVVGTISRKGDDLRGAPGLEDRPHRRSEFLAIPDDIRVVPADLLRSVAEATAGGDNPTRANVAAPQAYVGGDDARFDCTPAGVRAWLEVRGVAVKAERRNGDKTLLLLERCPINPEIVSAGGSDIAVLVGDDGKLAYCNLHNRGQAYTWHDLRRALDPEYEGRAADNGRVDLSNFAAATASRRGSSTPFEPPTAWELLDQFPSLREPVIEGLLRRGETMNIIASPKTGKSWLALDLALAVVTGKPWLETFATRGGEVLILDNELHRETSAHRLSRVAGARGYPIADYGARLRIHNMRGQLKDLFSLGEMFVRLPPDRYSAIILDAFYRFMPRDMDENDNGTMANLYNHLDLYADRLGCCFVLIHHTTKGNQAAKSVTDVGAGAGSQSRATDTHLILRAHEQPDVVVLDAAVRSWPPLPPRCLCWTFPVWTPADDLDPAELRGEKRKAQDTAQAEWTAESFTRALVTAEVRPRDVVLGNARIAGLSAWRATCLLREAEARGLIHRHGKSRNRPSGYSTQPPVKQESECDHSA